LQVGYRKVWCAHCGGVRVERLEFADSSQRVTHRLAAYAVELCRLGLTVKTVAQHLVLDPKTVKALEKAALQAQFGRPRYPGLRRLAIDEIAVKKGRATRPTLEIHGIRGGFVTEGQKTVIPAKVVVKASMRLVPDMNPKEAIRQYTAYVKKLTPKGIKTAVRVLSSAPASMVSTESRWIAAATTALEQGFGKKTVVSKYPVQNRAGKGVYTVHITRKTGDLVGVRVIKETDELMIISTSGQIIRMPVSQIRTTRTRSAQGVRAIRMKEDEKIVDFTKYISEEDAD
jgi:DNA gyrase/topoisomerase IV subunit A